VAPGYSTYIALEREFKRMLPVPYSNCEIESDAPVFRPNAEFYNLIARSEYAYTQQLCFAQCLQKYVLEKFGCTFPYLVSLLTSNVSKCEWDFNETVVNFQSIWREDFINEACLPQCPLECNQTFFKPTLSFYQLIGRQFAASFKETRPKLVLDFINRTLDAEQVEKSLVQVYVFYDSLSYLESFETPKMDVVSLLASIGGNMSLFLGVSVFSLCEVAQLAIEIVYVYYGKRTNRIGHDRMPMKDVFSFQNRF